MHSMSGIINNGEIVQDQFSKVHLAYHSKLKLSKNAQILLESESKIEISFSIEMYPKYQWLPSNQGFILKHKSSIRVQMGSFLGLYNGQMEMNEVSMLQVWTGNQFYLVTWQGSLKYHKETQRLSKML